MFKENQEIYKVSVSTGKMQLWYSFVEEADVVCVYGELGGKLQENRYTATPKNVGRSNGTTAEQQAHVELQAKYKAQLENKHYKLTKEEATEAAKVCREPRKITDYKKRFDKMSDRLLSSIKLNGSRACVIDGVLYSKVGRPEEVKVKHIRDVIEKLNKYGLATFDCEIYAHGLSLQRIRSAWLKPEKTDREVIKVAKDRAKSMEHVDEHKNIKTYQQAVDYLQYDPNEDAAKLTMNIFDIPTDKPIMFVERVDDMYFLEERMEMVLSEEELKHINFLYPEYTNSHEERVRRLQEVYELGYEGLVHYEPTGVYEFGKRSTNTCKAKPRLDAEAFVEGIELCKNGQGKLVLRASDDMGRVSFKAMMKGTAEEREYSRQEKFIGQWVNYQYEELSEKGVPTKPVVMETRLCDEDGSPLE